MIARFLLVAVLGLLVGCSSLPGGTDTAAGGVDTIPVVRRNLFPLRQQWNLFPNRSWNQSPRSKRRNRTTQMQRRGSNAFRAMEYMPNPQRAALFA